jgi:hypothetical protein
MTGRDPRCTVCRHSRRDEIDRLLLSGTKPADVFRDLAEGAGLSRAATFRHARAHLPLSILAPAWLDGESTVGDLVSDLGGLRRSLISQRASALATGNHSAALHAAQRIESVSATILREVRVETDEGIAAAIVDDGTVRILGTALQRLDPERVAELAAIVRGLSLPEEFRRTRDDVAADLDKITALHPKKEN